MAKIKKLDRKILGISQGFFVALAIVFFVTTLPAVAQEDMSLCVLASGRAAGEVAVQVGQSAKTISELQEVFAKITAAAHLSPNLLVCRRNAFNAFASSETPRHRSQVSVNTGTLSLIGTNKDMLARILGHELAHLYFGHTLQKQSFEIAAKEQEYFDREFIFQRRVLTYRDIATIRETFIGGVNSFSRKKEMEADEFGIRLAKDAGFTQDVALQMASLFRASGEPEVAGFLDTHPGYLERFEVSRFVEKNERMLDQARDLTASKNWPALGRLVNTWIAIVPESAAAYLYQGFWLDAVKMPMDVVAEAFEDSVARYEKPKLAEATQRNQREASVASLALGVALYHEGWFVQSLSNFDKLVDGDQRLYRDLTGWKSVLITSSGYKIEPESSVWHALNDDGVVVISNLEEHKDEKWMKPVHSWSAPRRPKIRKANVSEKTNIPAVPHETFTDIVDAARAGDEMDIYDWLKYGASLNEQRMGISALGAAVLAGKIDNASYLIMAGANPNTIDGFRRSPRDYAVRMGRMDILEMMQKIAKAAENNSTEK